MAKCKNPQCDYFQKTVPDGEFCPFCGEPLHDMVAPADAPPPWGQAPQPPDPNMNRPPDQGNVWGSPEPMYQGWGPPPQDPGGWGPMDPPSSGPWNTPQAPPQGVPWGQPPQQQQPPPQGNPWGSPPEAPPNQRPQPEPAGPWGSPEPPSQGASPWGAPPPHPPQAPPATPQSLWGQPQSPPQRGREFDPKPAAPPLKPMAPEPPPMPGSGPATVVEPAPGPPQPLLSLMHASGKKIGMYGQVAYLGRRGGSKKPQPELDLTDLPYSEHISRPHAYINWDKEKAQYSIVDTQSTNGTYLNGYLLNPGQSYPLSDGDQLDLGHQRLVKFTIGIA